MDLAHFYQQLHDELGDEPIREKYTDFLERKFKQAMSDEFGEVA